MLRSILTKSLLPAALIACGNTNASAGGWWETWGWWESCHGYHCYGPPYGNSAPPPVYVYDHRVGPTWTGNGWAYLPVGTYHPVPPAQAPLPRPAPYAAPAPDLPADPEDPLRPMK